VCLLIKATCYLYARARTHSLTHCKQPLLSHMCFHNTRWTLSVSVPCARAVSLKRSSAARRSAPAVINIWSSRARWASAFFRNAARLMPLCKPASVPRQFNYAGICAREIKSSYVCYSPRANIQFAKYALNFSPDWHSSLLCLASSIMENSNVCDACLALIIKVRWVLLKSLLNVLKIISKLTFNQNHISLHSLVLNSSSALISTINWTIY
jgi:hypothetical protein